MKTDQTMPLFDAPKMEGPHIRFVVNIEFDGGTPRNIPRLGYGNGYGSYQLNGGQIVRVEFGAPMSSNVAEIRTLIVAIKSIGLPVESTKLLIHGDSQIALNRCLNRLKPKKRNGDFGLACEELFSTCQRYACVRIHWRGRAASVRLFGH